MPCLASHIFPAFYRLSALPYLALPCLAHLPCLTSRIYPALPRASALHCLEHLPCLASRIFPALHRASGLPCLRICPALPRAPAMPFLCPAFLRVLLRLVNSNCHALPRASPPDCLAHLPCHASLICPAFPRAFVLPFYAQQPCLSSRNCPASPRASAWPYILTGLALRIFPPCLAHLPGLASRI
jgi:hypothetical protein